MKLPKELRYTKSHEWVRKDSDGTFAIGITDHAQEQLGDIVFVEAPKDGTRVTAGDSVGVDRKSTRLNSSHHTTSRMPSSA